MTKDSQPSVAEPDKAEAEKDKPKRESDLEIEDYDLHLIDEYISFPSEDEKAVKKMASRRKIEMYWEKKRLRDLLGEFNEEDLDF